MSFFAFTGRYDQKIDPKKRIIIPSCSREDLAEDFVMIPSPDGCIYAYPSEVWYEKVEEAVQSGTTAEGRRQQSRLFGMASKVQTDKSGRVTLPQNLFAHAGLTDTVAIVGVGSRIEIWNPTVYDEYLSVEDETVLPDINY